MWMLWCFFFFNDTASTEIYTLSLHDALPISKYGLVRWIARCAEEIAKRYIRYRGRLPRSGELRTICARSEEHTSELQSHVNLVCRLLLEKKKQKTTRKRHAGDTRLPLELYTV